MRIFEVGDTPTPSIESLAPVNCAETAFSEQHVHEANGPDRLIPIFDVGVTRIPV